MSHIDAGEPSNEAVQAEATLSRLDEWQRAYNILRDRFESFGPYDVMSMVTHLRGGKVEDDDE